MTCLLRLAFPVLSVLLCIGGDLKAAAETYIVPVWASGLPSSDGKWWSQALLINPHPFPVTYQVTGAYPLAVEPCAICTVMPAPVITIEPGGIGTLMPPALLAKQRVMAGTLEVQSSDTLNIHFVAYRPGESEIRQRLHVARGWLSPGVHNISTVEFAFTGVRRNVFITNPSDSVIEIAVWMASRAENEIRTSIAPRSTAVVSLPMPLCGGAPCSYPTPFPPEPLRVSIESTGTFLAAVSAVGPTWAVFSLPDTVVPTD